MSDKKPQSDREVADTVENTPLSDDSQSLVETVAEGAHKHSSSLALKFFITLTLVIALFSTAASYMVWMQQQKMNSSADASLNKKLQDILQPLQVTQKTQVDAIQAGLEQNRKTIQQTLQSQQALQQHLQRKADNDVNLIEAESLLRLAENRLELLDDIETAVLALQAADRLIMNYSQPEVIAVRQQIETELKSLQDVIVPDVKRYLGDIQLLVNRSDTLPLISASPKVLTADVSTAEVTEQGRGGWRETWNNMLTELKPLFAIRRTHQVTPAMLGVEEERLVRAILKGRYELMRQAVLLKDGVLLKDTIQGIENWQRLYFDMEHVDAQSTVKYLEDLKSVELIASYPQVGVALKQLREYRLKESGKREQK